MRVLLVNDRAPDDGGGAETHLARLIAGLEATGDNVETFAGQVHHRGAAKLLDLWDPVARRRLASLATRFSPDVVHHHNVWRELSPSVLGIPPGTRCVLTCHDHRLLGGADGGGLRSLKAGWDRSVARRRVDVAVAVSAALAEGLRAAGFRRVEHVPGFAEPPPAGAVRPVGATRDVVFAGRLAPEKGVGVLAGAFRIVAGRLPDARLVVAGDGPLRGRLEELGQAIGPDRVVLLGHRPPGEMPAVLGAARVVAVPSVGLEGSPAVVIEAALAGRPLVVSDGPGLRELVDLSGGGLVVPAGAVEELAAALGRLLEDEALADRMGAAARRLALDRHTVEAGVTRLRAIYRGDTERPPGPATG